MALKNTKETCLGKNYTRRRSGFFSRKQSKASQAIESIRLLRHGPNRFPRTRAPREIISKARKM